MQVCGICKRPPRQGEKPHRIRLAEPDMADEKYPMPKAPGLYQCCEECFTHYRGKVARRLDHPTPDEAGEYDVM